MSEQAQPMETGGVSGVKKHPFWVRLGLVVVILVAGLGGMKGLASMRKEPEVRKPARIVAKVDGMRVSRQDVQTILSGYGTARAHRTTALAPEVAGRVIGIHDRLEVGNIVRKGDLLFEIDPTDYELAVRQSEAEVERLEKTLDQMAREEEKDAERLEIAVEIRAAAEREFERIQALVRADGAESQSRLDAERRNLNQAQDAVIALERAMALYEPRRKQTEAQLKLANAQLEKARVNLGRTRVDAPFTGRVLMKHVESDQFVGVGTPLVELADDSVLEIPVSIEGREVSRWLDAQATGDDLHWFGRFGDGEVKICWTEDPGRLAYSGRIERVESYDSSTRTFELLVRVDPTSGKPRSEDGFVLTDGMFCTVDIPGRIARDVVPIPRDAVDSDGTVLVSVNGRLQTRPVKIARYQQNVALVEEGLNDGEIILTQRPPHIVDGMNVDVELMSAENGAILTDSETEAGGEDDRNEISADS